MAVTPIPNFFSTEHRLGVSLSMQQIDSTPPVQTKNDGTAFGNNLLPVGTIVRAVDTTNNLGGGEFIYLQGVASNLQGALVTYNATTGAVALLTSTPNLGQPVAVSMSANTAASNYSWYCIEGYVPILKTAVTVTPQLKAYISGATGRLFVTSTSGRQLLGIRTANLTTVTSTTSSVTCLVSRPFAQGQIT